MHVPNSEIEKFIADSGLVSLRDLEAARKTAEESKTGIGEVLISRGYISRDDLRRVYSYVLGIPFADLKGRKLSLETLSLIPEPISRASGVVCFSREGDTIELAMLEPRSVSQVEFLNKKYGLKINQRLTDVDSIKSALVFYQKVLQSEFGEAIRKESADLKKEIQEKGKVSQGPESPSLNRLFESLIKHALNQRASEIHFAPHEDRVTVRYRLNGSLYEAMILPKEINAVLAQKAGSASGLKETAGARREGYFKTDFDGEKVSFRVLILPTSQGEKIFIKVLPENSHGFTLEGLGFSLETSEAVRGAIDASSGFILIAGPKGSGKTTLLYTLLDLLNDPRKNISAIEEVVSMEFPMIAQVQANGKSGLNYQDGLRAIFRQQPDIVGVGEIKDAGTAILCVEGASDKLVIGGITASSPAEALAKLVEYKVDSKTIALNLKGIIFPKVGAQEFIRVTPALRDVLAQPFTKEALISYFESNVAPEDLTPKQARADLAERGF